MLVCAFMVACGGGGGGGGGGGNGDCGGNSGPPPASVTVSGRITFERVPFFSPTDVDPTAGLNYGATFAAPARAIVVELLNSSTQAVLSTTATDEDGNYSFTAPPNTNVRVRAKAETRRGAPGWDIRVLNNTNGNALYVLDSSAFNTCTANVTRNLLADSGWPDFGGTTYSGMRAAAPFAILDTMYSALRFVMTNGSSTLSFPALEVFWSTQNNNADGVPFNPEVGDIHSTLYLSNSNDAFPDGIYVLGLAGTDTDEFDQHVLAHEFQHFLEDAISRTESPGGPHSPGDRSDMRLAFSEGFANAYSAMVLGDPIYKDSMFTAQGSRLDFDVESNAPARPGWFSEGSVASIAWDLFDATNEAPDTVSLGYGPIYEVLTTDFRTTPALVSVYPFLSGLKSRSGAPVDAINTLAQSQLILAADAFGTGETNGGGVAEALPIYTDLTVDSGARRVCGTTQAGTFNAIGNRLFLRFSLASARTVTISAQFTTTGSTIGGPDPDPDIVLYYNGFLAIYQGIGGTETASRNLEPGEYVLEVYEYSHVDPSPNPLRRGVTCMNVSVG
jgi:hypothetical protein